MSNQSEPEVFIRYSSWHEGVEIKDTFLKRWTHVFVYPAPWVGTPSGMETRTAEATVSREDVQALLAFIDSTGFYDLDDEYGGDPDRRYYGYGIEVKAGVREKKVLYRSRPDVPPRPEAFKKVEEAILDFGGKAISG